MDDELAMALRMSLEEERARNAAANGDQVMFCMIIDRRLFCFV
jgi:hypothetical protein